MKKNPVPRAFGSCLLAAGAFVASAFAWSPAISAAGEATLFFDGSASSVQTGLSPADLGIEGNNSKTMEAWVFVRDFNEGGIFHVGTSDASQEFALRTHPDDNKFVAQFWGPGEFDFTVPDALNNWIHLALVYDGTTATAYVNGTLANSSNPTLNTQGDQWDFTIGSWRDQFFDGSIRDVRVWNVARSQAEIEATMNSSPAGETGLMAWWPLDEGEGTAASDASGNGRDGTIVAAVWGADQPPMDLGEGDLLFDGTASVVQTGLSPADLGIEGNNAKTVEAWVFARDFDEGGIFHVGTSDASQEFALRTHPDDNKFIAQFWGPGEFDFTVPDALNNWIHLALVYDGTTATAYVNGEFANSSNPTLNTQGDQWDFTIGSWRDQFFDGSIRDVRVWNVARSQAQIQATMSSSPAGETGLAAWWPLDEGEGTVANDTSGNGRNGTIVAATWGAEVLDLNEGDLLFDGIGSFVQTGLSPADLGIEGNNSKTVEAWVFARDFNEGGIFHVGTSDASKEFALRTHPDDNKFVAQFWGSGEFDFTVPEALNNWIHIALVYDGTTATAYANGEVAGTSNPTLNTQGDEWDFTIGSWRDRFFNGSIRDVRVWNVARSQAEIQATMESSPAGATGLMAWWPLNEGQGKVATDASGNGRDGTIVAALWFGEELVIDYDLTNLIFDGSGSVVETGLSPVDLGIEGNNSKTVEAWVLARSFNEGGVFHIGTNAESQEFALRTSPEANRWIAQFWGPGDTWFTVQDSLNNWVHFALVYDGTTATAYANGEVVATKDTVLNTQGDQWDFRIGFWSWTAGEGDRFFDGSIRDVRIWNVARSQADIQATMDASPSGQSGLMAWWPLDEGQGNVANDASGNGRPGTIINAGWYGETQFGFEPLAADFALDFGIGAGKANELSLLRARPGDFSLQPDALRLTSGSSTFLSTAAVASVSNRSNTQGFVLETEMRLHQLMEVNASRVGLVVLGGPHVPIDEPFNPEDETDYYTLSFFPALQESALGELFPGIVSAGDDTAVISIARGFDGGVLTAARWDGRKPFPAPALIEDDFENAATDASWQTGGPQDSWEIGTPTRGPAPVTGSRVAATNLGGDSSTDSEDWLRSPVIDLTGASAASFSFTEALNITDLIDEDTGQPFHNAIVSVVDESGEELAQLARYSGNSDGWRERSFAIPTAALGQKVRVEFHLSTDNFVFGGEFGWMVDNFSVTQGPQDTGAYALKAQGEYSETGDLLLTFTLTDLEDAGNYSQTVSTTIQDPLNGNLFGIGGHLQRSALGNPQIDFGNLSMTVDAPAGVTFSDWQDMMFPNAEDRADPEISGRLADPAGDGVANLLKYAFGFDPWTPVGSIDLPQADLVDGKLTLTYAERVDAIDIAYVPEKSFNLTGWDLQGIERLSPTVLSDDGEFEWVTIQLELGAEAKAFLRVQVLDLE